MYFVIAIKFTSKSFDVGLAMYKRNHATIETSTRGAGSSSSSFQSN